MVNNMIPLTQCIQRKYPIKNHPKKVKPANHPLLWVFINPLSWKIICGTTPKIDKNKFDGFDPTNWVTQMEHYFSIHSVTYDMEKLRVGLLYLDQERW